MKLTSVFAVLIVIWTVFSFIILAIEDTIHAITFGTYSPNFGSVGKYVYVTVQYWYVAFGFAAAFLVVGAMPTTKSKVGMLLIVFGLVAVYYVWRGLITYGIP